MRRPTPHPTCLSSRPPPPTCTACHFLFYTGKVRTPLLVEHDAAAGAMTYRVPCKAECCLFDGQSGMCGHLAALEGSWRVEAGKALQKGAGRLGGQLGSLVLLLSRRVPGAGAQALPASYAHAACATSFCLGHSPSLPPLPNPSTAPCRRPLRQRAALCAGSVAPRPAAAAGWRCALLCACPGVQSAMQAGWMVTLVSSAPCCCRECHAPLQGSWRAAMDCGRTVARHWIPCFVLLQVRSTCEDLYAEALRIQAGRPTLPPSSCAAAACSGQPSTGSGSKLSMGASRDPTSVLDRTYASSHGSEDGSTSGSRPHSSLDSDSCDDSASSSPFATAASSGSSAGSSGRSGRTGTAAAAVVASSAAGPASFPLPLHRLLSAASMLSGASGCLDGCWPALAASPASAPRAADSFGQAEGPVTSGISLAEHSALPASSHHLLAGRPSWLVVAATAVLALLVTLLRSL